MVSINCLRFVVARPEKDLLRDSAGLRVAIVTNSYIQKALTMQKE